MRVERAEILGLGDPVHAENAARDEYVEIAAVTGVRLNECLSVSEGEVAMRLIVGRGRELGLLVRLHFPRLAVLRQEMLARGTERRLHRRRVDGLAPDRLETADQHEKRVLRWTGIDERLEPAAHAAEDVEQEGDAVLRRPAAPSNHVGLWPGIVRGPRVRRSDG